MLNGGGLGNGSMWIAPTKSARDLLLQEAHFMMSTVLRLGCESNSTGRLCALLKFRDDHARRRLTEDSTIHSHAKLDFARTRQHKAFFGDLDEPARAEWAQADKERTAPHKYEFETIKKSERVVKEAISDLAADFPEQLCTHWIDVSVRAPVVEIHNHCEESGSLSYDGRKRYKGKALPTVMERFGRLGPETEKVLNLLAMAAGHTARARVVLHVW